MIRPPGFGAVHGYAEMCDFVMGQVRGRAYKFGRGAPSWPREDSPSAQTILDYIDGGMKWLVDNAGAVALVR